MRRMEKLKKALKNLLIEYRSINTDAAVLSWDGEEDLTTGTSVYITDEEGNRSIPEDGNYVDEEKITYVVKNGIVEEIIPAPDENPEEQPETPAEEPAEETEEPVEEPVEEEPEEEQPAEEPVEEPVEEPAEEPVEEIPVEEVEEVAEEADNLRERIDELVQRISALEAAIATLNEFKAVVEQMSAGKPATEEFRETKVDPELFKNKDIQNLNRFFQ